MGKHDILLGTDWLKAHNPSINWQTSNIRLDRCPNTCTTMQPQDLQINAMELLPTLEWEMQYDDHFNTKYHSIDALQRIMAHLDKFDTQISRTMVSTNLAIKEQLKAMEIPLAFRKYDKVFLDKEAQQLPKHQPWDYKIDLIPGKQMRKTSIYCLTPLEKICYKTTSPQVYRQEPFNNQKLPMHAPSSLSIRKMENYGQYKTIDP